MLQPSMIHVLELINVFDWTNGGARGLRSHFYIFGTKSMIESVVVLFVLLRRNRRWPNDL